jgi:hypothetical protein
MIALETQRVPVRGSRTPAPQSTLRRKCSCGGTPGPTGECEQCRRKRLGRDGTTGPESPRRLSDGETAASAARPAYRFSNLGIHAQRKSAAAADLPVNEFEDCPADWRKEAEAALVLGRKWIANVLAGLSSLPDPIPPVVATLLNRNFHTTDRDQVKKIVGHFNTISSAISSKIEFECETSCAKNELAYVYGIWSDLHLCPGWHSAGAAEQADTIIHEIAHDAANRRDKAYDWQPAYATLSAAAAIDNADSYSTFAREAYGS